MLLLIGIIIVLPILWLLFSPIILRIDTKQQQYWVRWRGIASFQLKLLEDDLILRLQVWFWKKDFYPLDGLLKAGKPSSTKKAKKGRTRKKRNWKRFASRLLGSFRVKQFDLRLDTDDYVLNSYLYPVFHLLNFKPVQLGINYQGESSLELQIENRLIRLLRAILL